MTRLWQVSDVRHVIEKQSRTIYLHMKMTSILTLGFQPRPFSHLGAAHSFLFHLTGLDPETDAVGLDHAYAKPWTSYPEASMAKSMVTLFLTPGVRSTNSLTYRKIDGGDTGSVG